MAASSIADVAERTEPGWHEPPAHHGAALLAGVGAVPSYAPPGRAFFTPPLPPEYRNPFADKPTLRGTNTDGNSYLNRRPIPPPSLGPGHDRIPIRPPGQETSSPQVPAPPPAPPAPPAAPQEPQKKKPLNTPSHKPDELEGDKRGGEQANFTDFVPNSLNIPTISRILSGSNGRKEDIPDVLLRTVTAKPAPDRGSPASPPASPPAGAALADGADSTEGALAVLDPDAGSLDRPLVAEQGGETNTRRSLQHATDGPAEAPAPTAAPEPAGADSSTERYHNLANVEAEKKAPERKAGAVQRAGAAWPFAWSAHIYLATTMFTLLAVYSIFKIVCYNKFTHLFTQRYFISLHLLLVLVCLLRIFYMCYDPYNVDDSLPPSVGEILLHVPEILLSVAFASTVLFLLTNSINFKTACCAFLFRPRTIVVGGALHLLSCVLLHVLESAGTVARTSQGVERRALGLTCQIVFILACLTLGSCYLYVYRVLKAVLQKKSHTYIHGFQNLYQAIHINLATALLFVLMATLQIYGIFGVNRTSVTKFDWLLWGYQFSLRLIEISVVALISWVVSLKVGIVASLQHEKTDGQKISGLGLFPCAAGSSADRFEADYPAVCSANTNLHTYTLRAGKPVYEGAAHRPPDQCRPDQRFQLGALACDANSGAENYSGHSSIANAGHSSGTESSTAASAPGLANLIKHHPGYGAESASDDHYSNCDPALQALQDDPPDHEYNVIQYGPADFGRAQPYGSSRSHTFKHAYDRASARTNSNPRKKHRAKPKPGPPGGPLAYGYDDYGGYDAENSSYGAPPDPARGYDGPCPARGSQRRHSPSGAGNPSGSHRRAKGPFPDRPKSTDLYGFSEDPDERPYPRGSGTPQPAPRTCGYEAYSQPQDEIGPEAGGGSMLVAQDGFVRFRPLEDPPQT